VAILAVGSVAFDGLETPAGKRERVLGGSATYFSLAASFFTDVRVVAVVGEDFTETEESIFHARGVDLQGLERVPGKSFFWQGSYLRDLNVADTLTTELNVFANFAPKIPDSYRDSQYLFLGNIDPVLQAEVRAQLPSVRYVCGDTMNYWIGAHRENLLKVLPTLDTLIINDGEVRELAGETNLLRAARAVLSLGPKTLVVKHGEYGATAFFDRDQESLPFRAPTLPLPEVVDPTGAGDSFAGGFYGYLASRGAITPSNLKTAMFYGAVLGSFAVEAFGTERLQALTREEIDARLTDLRALSHLE
jgi:sugar/nucleoside kinase (ribokinase family)